MASFTDFFMMNWNSTDIDRRYCVRETPLKVLVLGYPRTGTTSLIAALKVLGYHDTYHGISAAFGNPRDYTLWWNALRAKFDGKGKRFGRKELDQLFGHCQVVSDLPAVSIAEDLIKAYPDAKVILTVRDVDKWHKSMKESLDDEFAHPLFYVFAFFDFLFYMPWRWIRPTYIKLRKVLYDGDFEKNGRQAFRKHYENIQSLVPPERLLLYHVSDGWEPLCKFLGDDVPHTPMPNINDTKTMRTGLRANRVYHVTRYIMRIFQILTFVCTFVVLRAAVKG